MGAKTTYLIAYNGACAAGWAYVLYLTLALARAGAAPAALWAALAAPLTLVQSAAALEVLHAALGLVNSPLATTAMQVASRLLLVWGYTRAFPASQADASLYLMAASWALVEVPRYLFYVFQVAQARVPFALFWLRYSLFMVLYPTGITGELLQMYAGLRSGACSPLAARATACVFAVYALGSPFMIWNMWTNRVRSFKKRAADASPPPPPTGLVWPVTNAATQERNSTPTNKHIWSEAVGAVSAEAQARLDRERNWRFGYARHAERSLQLSLRSAPDALAMARAGLAAAHASFRFRRGDAEMPLAAAMTKYTGTFLTGEITGAGWGKPHDFALEVPYGGRDPTKPYSAFAGNKDVLKGAALVAQLDKWAEWGTIERSAAESIKKVVRAPAWMDLSDRYFVLLGATSAMGPLDLLLQYGANVIAVDIDRPGVWATIIKKARASRGRVFFPISADKAGAARKTAADFESDAALAAASGANLLAATPEIANWLKTVCPGKALTIGNYTYLDGALHVQLSVGCDAIIQAVCAERKSTSIAFLCTPTDLHVIPREASEAAAANAAAYPLWLRALAALGTSALRANALPPVRTAAGEDLFYVDGLSVAQGPNYGLAKRLQHWRAIVARGAGHRVSSNIAPSTATASVTSNFMFQMAYGGFHIFRPLEVMYQCVPPRARAPL